MRVTLCQIGVGLSKEANLGKAVSAIASAAERGASLAVLPEFFNSPYCMKSAAEYSEELRPGFPTYDAISRVAKEKSIWVIAGSVPEKLNGKVYNSSMVFDSSGNLKHIHRKIHLFRINTDVLKMDENEILTPGNAVTPVETIGGVKFGIGICFDVRFPLLAWKYASEGTSFLVYPGAFNMVTGPLHWELAARSRAVDNQQYVLMCSPARDPDGKYMAWGHSMVVDPLGRVVASADESETYVDAELDFSLVETIRKQIPIFNGVRNDLYSLQWN